MLRPPPLTIPTLIGEQIPQEGARLLSQREALGPALTPNLCPAPSLPFSAQAAGPVVLLPQLFNLAGGHFSQGLISFIQVEPLG